MLDEKKEDKEDVDFSKSSMSSQVQEVGSPLDFSEEFKKKPDAISSIIEQN